MADAGEHDLGGLAQTFRIADQRVGRADFFERIGDRAQVARAVIENGDHNNPLVEGRSPLRLRSFEQANLRARAKHLKSASTW